VATIDTEGKTKQERDEEFRQEQKTAAAAQGLTGENAVPEQRPIASQRIDDSHQSATYLALRDNDELPSQEPMGREAYEKAASDSQASSAAKDSVADRLWTGQRVKVLKEPYKDLGVMGVILNVTFTDAAEEAKANSGNPALSRFAKVDEYIVRTRGGRSEVLYLKPDEVRPVDPAAYGRAEL
jgi:hypothetical protein